MTKLKNIELTDEAFNVIYRLLTLHNA